MRQRQPLMNRCALAFGATLVGAGLSAVLLDRPANAAWETVPDVGLSTEVDDNIRLVSIDQPSSARTALDARLRVRNFGRRGEAFIEPRIVADSYAAERDKVLQNNDVFLLARAAYDFSMTRIEFQSDYRRESVLRSEIGSALGGPPELGGEPVDTGGGSLTTFTNQRKRLDLAFNVQFQPSERTRFRIETNRIDVGYPGEQEITRTPFDNNTLAAVLTRLVDQRNEVSATAYVSDFHAQLNDNNTRAFGVQGAFMRPLSKIWTFSLNAGVARRDYEFLSSGMRVSNADSSFTYGTDFEGAGQRSAWSIVVGRSLGPNSNGFLSRRDEVRLQLRREFQPRLSASIGLRAARIDASDESPDTRNRDYARLSLQVQWAMTQRWYLTTGLDKVTETRFDGGSGRATSNAVLVGIRYRGLSRERGGGPNVPEPLQF